MRRRKKTRDGGKRKTRTNKKRNWTRRFIRNGRRICTCEGRSVRGGKKGVRIGDGEGKKSKRGGMRVR